MIDQTDLLHAAFDGMSDHVAVLDGSGTVVAVNAAWKSFGRANGAPVGDGYLGSNYLDVCRAATAEGVANATACYEGLAGVLARQRNCFEFEYPCHAPNRERWFALRAAPLATAGDHVVVAHHDITARKLAEREARDAARLQSVLLAITNRLLTRTIGTEAYQAMLEQAVGLVPRAQLGSILVRGEDDRFHFVAAHGFDLERLRMVSLAQEELYFATRQGGEKRSYIVRAVDFVIFRALDAERLETLRSAGVTHQIKVALGVPIRSGGKVAALLSLDNLDAEEAFTEHDRQLAEAIGAQVGLVFQHLETQRALRESEERFRAIVSQATAGILRTDLEGAITFVNRTFAAMLGRDEAELLSGTIWELTHPDDLAPARALFERLRTEGTPFETEMRLQRRDGSDLWVALSVALLRDDRDEPRSTVAVVLDISTRRRSEAQLSQAIQEVLDDASWFGRAVMERLANIRGEEVSPGALADLTQRERDVLVLLAQGFDNSEIAARLGLATATVRNYVSRIYGKLNLGSRAEAVVWARERGLTLQG